MLGFRQSRNVEKVPETFDCPKLCRSIIVVKEKSQFHDCPKCGAGGIIPDENGRCTHCGAVITEPTIRQARPSPMPQSESVRNKQPDTDGIDEDSIVCESQQRPGVVWWVWRLAGVLVFIVGLQIVTVFIGMAVAAPPYYADSLGPCGIGIAVMLGAIFLMLKWPSRRFSAGTATTDENYDKWLVAISIAACVPWGNYFIRVPEFITFIAFLIVLAGGIGLLIKCKPFRWRNYVVVGLACGSVVLSILVPTFFRIQERVTTEYVKMRADSFEPIIAECSLLCTPDQLMAAINSPRSGTVGHIKGVTLVLEAIEEPISGSMQVNPSILEWYVPRNLPAPDMQAVRVLVITGPIGPEIQSPGISEGPSKLIAPILVYSWPEKKLLLSGKLESGCVSSDASLKVYRRSATALHRLLITNGRN